MKRIIILFLVIIISRNTLVFAGPGDRVLALVNGEKITQAEIDLYVEKGKSLLPKHSIKYFEDWVNKDDVLNELIWDKLAFQEGRRLSIEYKTDKYINVPIMLFEMRRKKETANIYKDRGVQVEYYRKNKKYIYNEPSYFLNYMAHESLSAAENAVVFARSKGICDFTSNYKILMGKDNGASCVKHNLNSIRGKILALSLYPLDIIQQLNIGKEGVIIGPFKNLGRFGSLCITKNTFKGSSMDLEKFTSELMENKDDLLRMIEHNRIKDNAVIVIYR